MVGGNAAFCRQKQTGKSYEQGEFSFKDYKPGESYFNKTSKHLMIESAAEFLNTLKKNDRIVLLYHKDGDGICGAYFIAKALQFKDIQIKRHIMSDPLLLKNDATMTDIISQNPSVIIAVDLPLDQNPNELNYLKARTNTKILVVDHHLIKNNLNNHGMVHVSSHLFSDLPEGFDPSQYCGTMLAYDIACHVTRAHDISHRVDFIEIEKYKWALAGMICDCGKNVKNTDLETVYREYSRNTIEKLEDILTIYGHGGSDPSLPLFAMLCAKKPEEIITGESFWAHLIMAEYPLLVEARDEILSDIQKSAQIGKPFGSVTDFSLDEEIKSVIIEISHAKFLASDIATLLSRDDFKDYVVTVMQVHDGTTKAKLRCQSGDVDVKSVAYNLGLKISGFGGGHKRASGVEYPTKNLAKSKTELLNLIREEKNVALVPC